MCNGPKILMYHRVGPVDRNADPWEIAVSPAGFEAQMEALASRCEVLPLSELGRRLSVGDLSPDVAVVTFDDGYAEILSTAAPILRRLGLPATVFITTGAVDEDAFWWDRLAQIVLTGRVLPELVDLQVDGLDHAVSAPGGDPERREKALWALRDGLLDAAPGARALALDRLTELLEPASPTPATRPLTSDEVHQLVADGIEVGAHTVTHPRLATLDAAAQQHEITGSLRACESLTGSPPSTFAYPYGSYDQTSRDLLRDAGVLAGCTTDRGVVTSGSDPLALPRLGVAEDLEGFLSVIGGPVSPRDRRRIAPQRGGQPSVTVVVPVFNAADHLGDCLDSILSQSLASVEVICIDDASTDASPAILRRYARRDPRVAVLKSSENVGAGRSRNRGIDVARGRFVQFVDADDVLPEGALAALFERALAEDADVVRGMRGHLRGDTIQPASADHIPARRRVRLIDEKTLWIPWWHTCFLISTRLLVDQAIRYPGLRSGEDPVFLAAVLVKARAISIVDAITYCIRSGAGGADDRRSFGHLMDYLAHAAMTREILRACSAECWDRGYGPFVLGDIERNLHLYAIADDELPRVSDAIQQLRASIAPR